MEWRNRQGLRDYNIFRWYRSGWSRYTTADPIGLRGGINLYSYARNPIGWSDPLGLKVEKCCRPADILFGWVDHCWIKTDKFIAGLGEQGGVVPGHGSPRCNSVMTQVVDHSQENGPDVTCEEIPDVVEECVNSQFEAGPDALGSRHGLWLPIFNDCRTLTRRILGKCKKACGPNPRPPVRPYDDGRRYF